VAVLTEQLSSLVAEHRTDLETDLSILAKTTRTVLRHQDSLVRTLDWLPVLADGAEEGHKGGAVHSGSGPTHVDVRDAHLFSCPPDVPSSLCLLFGLTGQALPFAATPAAGQPGAAGAGAGAGAAPPKAPDPADLLDRLPISPLGPAASSGPATPRVRGFFERIGGFFDRAVRWLS
jgi:hypothetical protein